MYARPAGLSDEESDDDGFSFYDEVPQRKRRNAQATATAKLQAETDKTQEPCFEEGERELQFQVMHACMAGHLEVINEYITLGHNPNDFLNSGWTPLLYAASSVRPDVVEYLLSLGVDPNKHKDGFTPLMALCNANAGTPEASLKCLQLLISANGNVNATNKYNETALMLACKEDKSEVVKELLKHVDNVNFINNEGKSALFYAVLANKPEILKILLEYNVDLTIKDKHNYTARDIAIAKGYDKLALLLSTEADDLLEVADISENVQTYCWRDMFPMLSTNSDKYVNFDIATILCGMGMERYKSMFEGIDLKTFLKLTEEDLVKLGFDMPFQRRQFMEGLHKFHVKSWSAHSIGAIRKSLPYTLYDGVVSLGHAAKQIGVIGSGIRFIKNSLEGARKQNLQLSDTEKMKYSGQLQKSQQSLLTLEKELIYMKTLAKKISKDTKLIPPADYIGPKKKKSDWTIIIGVTLIIGMYLSRTNYIQRIWN
ncbi:ankyrin repeat, SAM and basic leucine zipper domain-containing protein 1 isoform X1 [Neodiprion lecontei]|uniref:Ankyrin repeat, SAM and basic leucine zipper domain-containing protein 1 isoform X1 n=2 Tax=Neodiprion lecontei TaxID=441921 RepID=A0A6J0BHX9_NEOLC|nr:ankyrin repeat, SAM and basic leucine zipper domain-containing protein 1 isoform X1 [Neodiprion lecontei]